MKVCVLQPDYTDSQTDYRNYDPPRDLTALLPGEQVDHLFLRKVSVYRQLREASRRGYDIYVNLCEGYLDQDVPSLDVITALDLLQLPYTGPPARLYDPSKPLMKYVAHTQNVCYPAFVEAQGAQDAERAIESLRPPWFVKPAHQGDSHGVDAHSYCTTPGELRAKIEAICGEYGSALIEEFIDGREFTVLVAADPARRFEPVVYAPFEFVFPQGERFKTYQLKVASHHPECNVRVEDEELARQLKEAVVRMFNGFEGEGYARADFRLDAAGEIHFLDINFTCSVFYPEGHQGSADYILGRDTAAFLKHIMAEGIARHRRQTPPYERRGNASSGYGIFATRAIPTGEVIYYGEERAHRIVHGAHIAAVWPPDQREVFQRYAIRAERDLYLLWDADPRHWAPQNHCCNANTEYRGLDVVALRNIKVGEELTLDYANLDNPEMPSFTCNCGAPNCRRYIR